MPSLTDEIEFLMLPQAGMATLPVLNHTPLVCWLSFLRTDQLAYGLAFLCYLACIFLYFFTKLYLRWVKARPMSNYLRDKL